VAGKSRHFIGVDDEVWRVLQEAGEPFVDDPNSVLRRLLNIKTDRRPTPGRTGDSGKRLPTRRYEDAVVDALRQLGGRGEARRVRDLTLSLLEPELGPADKRMTISGYPAYHSAISSARVQLIKKHILANDSPVGVWALAEPAIPASRPMTPAPRTKGEGKKPGRGTAADR
jgi:hypothetical protein